MEVRVGEGEAENYFAFQKLFSTELMSCTWINLFKKSQLGALWLIALVAKEKEMKADLVWAQVIGKVIS